MRRAAALLLFLAVACGSGRSARPATIPKPDLDVGLTHELFFGSRSFAPATIEVRIGNRSALPIVLRRVEISSPGMTQYEILPVTREFRQTIAPGETKSVTVFTTARTTTSRPVEPLTLRAVLSFAGGGSVWRELVLVR